MIAQNRFLVKKRLSLAKDSIKESTICHHKVAIQKELFQQYVFYHFCEILSKKKPDDCNHLVFLNKFKNKNYYFNIYIVS